MHRLVRILGLGSFIGAGVWHFVWHYWWEAVRAWLYERGFHMMNPYLFGITAEQMLHWGPTLSFLGAGIILFWMTSPTAPAMTPEPTPRPGRFYRLARELRARYINAPPRSVEMVGLDFVVEGNEAQRDITRLLNALGTEIRKLGKHAVWHGRVLNFIQDPRHQRRLYSRVARYWNAHADKLDEATQLMRVIGNLIISAQSNSLQNTPVTSKADYLALISLSAVISDTHDIALTSAGEVEGLVGAALSLRGRTGELDVAADRLSESVTALTAEIRRYAARCRETGALGLNRANEFAHLYE